MGGGDLKGSTAPSVLRERKTTTLAELIAERDAKIGPTSYRADDEEVPLVPDSKARQECLARQYSGDDALPAVCKFPWQPIG